MNFFVCQGGVATVVTFVCSSVANEMLECRDDTIFGIVVVALLSANKCCSKVNGEFCCLTESFINAAPAFVLRDGDGGGEIQIDVRSPHFFGDGLPDSTDKC